MVVSVLLCGVNVALCCVSCVSISVLRCCISVMLCISALSVLVSPVEYSERLYVIINSSNRFTLCARITGRRALLCSRVP